MFAYLFDFDVWLVGFSDLAKLLIWFGCLLGAFLCLVAVVVCFIVFWRVRICL